MMASCVVTRYFVVGSTATISVGMPVTFSAGFYNWANNSNSALPTASGVSTSMSYTVIEGALSLATMTVAAAALMTLSF